MMGALSQMPTQTGIASILAAIGPATPASGEEGGFEQLFASLPATADASATQGPVTLGGKVAPAVVAAAQPGFEAVAIAMIDLPLTTDAPSQAAAPAAILADPAAPVTVTPSKAITATPVSNAPVTIVPGKPALATKAVADAPVDDAAAAATLLIAVATPRGKTAPTAEAVAVKPATEETDGATAEAPTTAPAAPAAPVIADATGVAHAITVAAAPAQPALARALARANEDKPATDKPAKAATVFTPPHRAEADAQKYPAAVQVPKAGEAAQPLLAATSAAEPRAAKPVIDTAAAITVLFNQPATSGAALIGEAAKAAPVAERTLDLGSDDHWIAQLAADIAATKSDKGDISFRLMPRHLGRLDVAMRMEDGGVSLKLDTQHEATATIVQAAQPRLVEDLRQQGVRVTDAQVTHSAAEAGRQSPQQQGGQGRGAAADASHLIETAAERHDTETDERTADRRGRFA